MSLIKLSTERFLDNKYRTKLIENIINGKIKIDYNVCECVYDITLKTTRNGKPEACTYQQIILANLGYTLKSIGHGSYGIAGKVCATPDCSLNYSIKVSMYNPSYGAIDDPDRPENLQVSILRRLNDEILFTNMSPHIVLYIQHFNCRLYMRQS